MGSLCQVLAKTRHISDWEVAPGGQHARGRTRFAWGPLKRTVEFEMTLLGVAAERQIRYVIEVLSLETRVETEIDLALAGMNETRLHYRSLLAAGNRAVRMCHLFRDLIEEQADHILHQVKVKAEQRRLAHERLLT